jgi:short-subunit dehydrogenase
VALLINNAGYWGESSSFMTLDVAKARREMDVNYFGLLSVTSVFALDLKASSGGAVLNVLSFLALATWPVSGTYAASKAATLAVTRSLRAELAAQGTAVIGVMPVQMETSVGQILPSPRVAPQEAAVAPLDAVEQGVDEVFPGKLSRQSAKAFAADPKGVQAFLSTFLPRPGSIR